MILIFFSIFSLKYVLWQKTRLLKIIPSKDNCYKHAPFYTFYVIGRSENKEYSLLSLYDYSSYRLKRNYEDELGKDKSERVQKNNDARILWDEDDVSKYNYNLPVVELPAIVDELNKKLSDNRHLIQIELLNFDAVDGKQTVHLTYTRDDFAYCSEYQASGNVVLPLRYGDSTKADGFSSMMAGFLTFLVGLVIWFIVNKLWSIRKI